MHTVSPRHTRSRCQSAPLLRGAAGQAQPPDTRLRSPLGWATTAVCSNMMCGEVQRQAACIHVNAGRSLNTAAAMHVHPDKAAQHKTWRCAQGRTLPKPP
jgi:hypothetical protein